MLSSELLRFGYDLEGTYKMQLLQISIRKVLALQIFSG